MCNPTTAPDEPHAPDRDRAGPDAPAHQDTPAQSPEWLVHLLARLILFMLEQMLALRLRRSHGLPAWWRGRPDLPAGSAQALAAAVRGQFGNTIAWMCCRNGIGPGHPEWPALSRAIVAFGGSVKGFRAGAPARPQPWWQNPAIVPGMIPPASAPAASLLLRQVTTDSAPPAPHAVPGEAGRTLWPASWWQVFSRAGTGPPTTTGPPAAWAAYPMMSDERGRSTAGPAVLIRAHRKARTRPDAAYKFSSLAPLAFPATP